MSRIDQEALATLDREYSKAEPIYRATRYWQRHIDKMQPMVAAIDPRELESGRYPILSTFGFGGNPYLKLPERPSLRPRNLFKHVTRLAASKLTTEGQDWFLPYHLKLDDIHQLAFNRAQLFALRAGATPPEAVQASDFGNPQDLFYVNGRPYTIRFLDYFCRYAFAASAIPFRGDEVFVEIGSGSGKQIEVLKKVFPNAMFLCFDLPLQLCLANEYLRGVFPHDVAPVKETCQWTSLQGLEPGKIHLFGNWQTPLLHDIRFDVFWNAASFGEMEPHVVQNYLAHVGTTPEWIYLMQARHGKESWKGGGVETPQDFTKFNSYLPDYALAREQDYQASLYSLRDSGGYFEAVWRRNGAPEATR